MLQRHIAPTRRADSTLAAGRPSPPRPRLDQLGQLQQRGDMKRAAPRRDKNEQVHRHNIGPLRRQRDQLALLVIEIDAIPPPVALTLDELELLTGQRMERVRDPHPRTIDQIRAIGRS